MLTIKDIKDYKERYYSKYMEKVLQEEKEKLKNSDYKYTDDDIQFLVDSLKSKIDDRFNENLMECHKQELPNGQDISEILDMLRGSQTEKFCIFLIKEDNSYTYKILNKGDENNAKVSIRELIKFLLENDACKFAIAHNHPNSIAAFFSNTDARYDYAVSLMTNPLGLKFMDSFVVTDFDTVSRFQLETTNKNNHQEFLNKYPIIHPKFMNENIAKSLKEDNRIMFDYLELNIKYTER